jgi:hypothetical protein
MFLVPHRDTQRSEIAAEPSARYPGLPRGFITPRRGSNGRGDADPDAPGAFALLLVRRAVPVLLPFARRTSVFQVVKRWSGGPSTEGRSRDPIGWFLKRARRAVVRRINQSAGIVSPFRNTSRRASVRERMRSTGQVRRRGATRRRTVSMRSTVEGRHWCLQRRHHAQSWN